MDAADNRNLHLELRAVPNDKKKSIFPIFPIDSNFRPSFEEKSAGKPWNETF